MPALRHLLLVIILLLGAVTPRWLAAQEPAPIHHCVDVHGNDVFTDRLCAAMESTPVKAAAPASSAHDFSEPPPVLCADTDDTLKQAVISAFASHDANRLAGLMLWGGDGHRAASAEIRALAQWVQQPLIDVNVTRTGSATAQMSTESPRAPDPFDAPLPDADAASAHVKSAGAGSASPQLIVNIAGTEQSGVTQQILFGIVHRAGCVWLHNDD